MRSMSQLRCSRSTQSPLLAMTAAQIRSIYREKAKKLLPVWFDAMHELDRSSSRCGLHTLYSKTTRCHRYKYQRSRHQRHCRNKVSHRASKLELWYWLPKLHMRLSEQGHRRRSAKKRSECGGCHTTTDNKPQPSHTQHCSRDRVKHNRTRKKQFGFGSQSECWVCDGCVATTTVFAETRFAVLIFPLAECPNH
jgi:hypothetical protein